MPLSVPNYLRSANIQDNALKYAWDDWRTLPETETPAEGIVDRLKGISQRAVLAFACGTAEWIVYRFAKLSDDPSPWNYLEAAWAMIFDVRYCGYGSGIGWQEHSLEGWDGPVKRPIKDALESLEIAFQQLSSEYHTDPTIDAAIISSLTSYVMTDPAPYEKWCGQVLDRFESLYPRDPEDQLGDVVPRQAVNPEIDFDIEQTESLANQFLGSLDPDVNIFLSPAEGMLEQFEGTEDFKGTPYVFDLAADRISRLERE